MIRIAPLALLVAWMLPVAMLAADARKPSPVDEWLAVAREAQGRGLLKKAAEAADRAVEAAPQDPRPYHFRGELHGRAGRWVEAEADYGRAIERAPNEAALFLLRGTARLRLGQYQASVSDFDRYAALRPSRAGDLWQRGIALFLLDRYEEARRQFEVHRLVNPRDVENSAWHFACVAWSAGAETARDRWMPVQGDRRVPMREIAALLSGTGTEADVLQAVEAVPAGPGREEARFHAHFYLALFHGAWRRAEDEARHIARASELAVDHGLMGDIALRYADWVTARLRAARRPGR